MQIDTLTLTHFRNYINADISLKSGINVIYGANGHGKTNLLEALYTATQGHSFRTSKNMDMICWHKDNCIVRLTGTARTKNHSQSFMLTSDNKKRVKVNNQEYAQLSKLIGTFSVIPIVTNDIEIIQGAPANRRKFLDSVICQKSDSFLQLLKDYNRTLKQRNALLKHGPGEPMLWETLTQQLCELGAQVIIHRVTFIADILQHCQPFYEHISGKRETMNITYQSTVDADYDTHSLIDRFYTKLSNRRKLEFEIGSTLYGPHKDDFLLTLNNHDIRSFGSQGQCRSAAFSLKLAASNVLEHSSGEPPILLLDDIFAELDNTRRSAIGELIAHHSQVLVATPHKEDLPFSSDNEIHIHDGGILV